MNVLKCVAAPVALFTAISVFMAGFSPPTSAEEKQGKKDKSSWSQLTSTQRQSMENYATDYKSFIHKARTELTFVTEATALAKPTGLNR